MRLIDADSLKAHVVAAVLDANQEQEYRASALLRAIDSISTAYDVDKVMEQIKKIMEDESIRFVNQAVNRSVNIVKSGGIE